MALPMHLYLSAGTGNNIHGHSLWNSICDDGFNLTEQSVGNHICKGGARKNGKYHDIRPRGSKLLTGKTCAGEIFRSEIFPHSITAIISARPDAEKSTLLRCMNGLLKEESGAAVSGNILLKGQDIVKMEPEEVRRRGRGLVFQTPSPFPFSIYKNMTYALRYYGVKDKKELDRQVKEKLQMAGLYDEVAQELDKSAHKLSGGQQQRLCIARALTVEPEIPPAGRAVFCAGCQIFQRH